MRVRPCGPFGLCLVVLFVAALVFGGLAWVTLASLRVEEAQQEASARAVWANRERLALWRLDGHLLPNLGLESNRPFAHYTAVHESFPTVDIDQEAPSSGTVRLPSPLLSADLPPWMVLHFQIDPETGWESPQVVPADLADRLRCPPNNLLLTNVSQTRRDLLNELSTRFPKDVVLRTLGEFEQASPEFSPFVVPVPVADETSAPKPGAVGDRDEDAPGQTRPYSQQGATELLSRTDVKARVFFYGCERETSIAGSGFARCNTGYLDVAAPSPEWSVTGTAPTPSSSPVPPTVVSGYSVNPTPQPTAPYPGQPTSDLPPPIGNSVANNAPAQQQLPAYAFNRAQTMPNAGPVAGGKAVDPQSLAEQQKQEYSARLKATQQSVETRGGYEQFGQNLRNGLPSDEKKYSNIPQAAGQLANQKNAPKTVQDQTKDLQQDDRTDAAKKLDSLSKDAKRIEEELLNTQRQIDRSQRPAAPFGGLIGGSGGGVPFSGPAGMGGVAALTTPTIPELKPPTQRPIAPTNTEGGPRLPEAADEDTALAMRARAENVPVAPAAVPGARKDPPAVQPMAVHLSPLRAHWLAARDGTEVLVLVRAARLEHKTVYQGVLLDWPRVQDVLREQVVELFPDAALTPRRASEPLVTERAMTTLPIQLDPGPLPAPPPAGWTTLRIGLVLAWAAAFVALAAVGFAGRALVGLSERRIRFVSAVTHELRTPLTSLRLYLDLLTSGMVTDEAKQKEYLHTLANESDRLNRLIENVLDFAKLEKRSVQAVMCPTKLSTLLEDVRAIWSDRCAADDKELVVHSTLPENQTVVTDQRIALQILGNLVDNARKYSRGCDDCRIWVRAKPGERGRIVLEVEDRGPGVPSKERGSVFRAFRRGSDADTIAGGAGLGLALAKHWTDLIGGTLSYRHADGGVGACFRVELPANG